MNSTQDGAPHPHPTWGGGPGASPKSSARAQELGTWLPAQGQRAWRQGAPAVWGPVCARRRQPSPAGGRKTGGAVLLQGSWGLGRGGSVLSPPGRLHPPGWPNPSAGAKECAWKRPAGRQSRGHPEAVHRSGAEGCGAQEGRGPPRTSVTFKEEPGIPVPRPSRGHLASPGIRRRHGSSVLSGALRAEGLYGGGAEGAGALPALTSMSQGSPGTEILGAGVLDPGARATNRGSLPSGLRLSSPSGRGTPPTWDGESGEAGLPLPPSVGGSSVASSHPTSIWVRWTWVRRGCGCGQRPDPLTPHFVSRSAWRCRATMLSLKLPQLLRVHQVPRVRGLTHRLPLGAAWGRGSLSDWRLASSPYPPPR